MPASIPLALTQAFAAISAWVSANTLLAYAIVTAVSLGAAYLLRPDVPSLSGGLGEGSRRAVKQALPRQRSVYGRATTAGAFFFYDKDAPWLYIGYLVAAHACDAIEAVFINGDLVTFNVDGEAETPKYQTYLDLSVRLGAADQAADPLLAAAFPSLSSEFRQRGHTTAVIRAGYGGTADNHQALWGGTVFNPLFRVKGKKVYDPRQGGQILGDPSTYQWSDNGILCLLDMVTDPSYGNQDVSVFDMDQIAEAAYRADQPMGTIDGRTIKSFTINGVIDTSIRPYDILRNMLSAMAGSIYWVGDTYAIEPARAKDPDFTIDQSYLTGSFEYRQDRPRRQLLNSIRTEFVAGVERAYNLQNGPKIERKTTNYVYNSVPPAAVAATDDASFNAATTGYTAVGDASDDAQFSIVADTTALTNAGLVVTSEGLAFFIDNTAEGTDTATFTFDGPVNSTDLVHSASAYIRSTDATLSTDISIGFDDNAEESDIGDQVTSAYQQFSYAALPGAGTRKLRIRVAAGHSAYVVLPQLEERYAASTTFVKTEGGPVTKWDHGAEYSETIKLNYTQDSSRAMRIGKIYADEQATGRALSLSCDLRAFPLTAEDVIRVELEDFSYVNGIYKVKKAELGPDQHEVFLELIEYDKTAMDWTPGTASAPVDDQVFAIEGAT